MLFFVMCDARYRFFVSCYNTSMHHTHTFLLGTKTISYLLRKRRGVQHITLSVRADGRVILTAPLSYTHREAEYLLYTKKAWLTEVYAKLPVQILIDNTKKHKEYQTHKEQARAFVYMRLSELNKHYQFSYGRIAIRNSATSWGSCSSKKNLNFHYRILFLPSHLQDYLLVHELCHLKEMNHSSRFWELVAETVPDWKKCRKEMRAFALQY